MTLKFVCKTMYFNKKQANSVFPFILRTISDEDDNSGALAALGSFVTVLSIVILVLILRLVYFRYRKKKQGL